MGRPPDWRLYFAIAFAWSWAWWWLAAIGGWPEGARFALHLTGGAGPLLAVLAVVRRHPDPGYGRALLRRALDWRSIGPRWWLAILAVAAGPRLLALAAVGLGLPGDLDDPAGAAALPGVLAFALLAGFVEEPGWRGVALDGMRPRFTAYGAALLIGAAWVVWHLPLYFIAGTFQHDLGLGSADAWPVFLGPLPLSVLLVWLTAHTRWSILAAVLAHAGGNMAGEVLPASAEGRYVELAAVVVAAAAAVTLERTGRRKESAAAGRGAGGTR